MLITKILPLGLIIVDFGSLGEAKVDDTSVEFTLWCEERTNITKKSSSEQHPKSLV